MVTITDEIIQLIMKEGNVVIVGSVDRLGIPNISPRYVMAILDDKLVFADIFLNKTHANIQSWPKVTVAIVDKAHRGGFQLKGDVEIITDAEFVLLAKNKLRELGFTTGPTTVWALVVKEIYSIMPSEKSKLPIMSAYG